MLTTNLIKTELSIAYLKAVAAVSGISVEETRIDMDSVDARLAFKGLIHEDALLVSPLIEVQLKASSQNLFKQSGDVAFALPVNNYNDLRANTMVPRLLVLLTLPPEAQDWVTHRPEELILRRCAYYLSLRGAAPTSNQDTVTVTFPKDNLLDPATLKGLMVRVAKEEEV